MYMNQQFYICLNSDTDLEHFNTFKLLNKFIADIFQPLIRKGSGTKHSYKFGIREMFDEFKNSLQI
jgi:hypothetical protein